MAKQLLLLNKKLDIKCICLQKLRIIADNTFVSLKTVGTCIQYLPAFGASKTLIAVRSRSPGYLGLLALESPSGNILRSMCDPSYPPPIP